MLIQRHPDAQQILFRSTQKSQAATRVDEPAPPAKSPVDSRAWVQVPLKEVFEQHQKEGAPLVSAGNFNPIRWLLGARASAPTTVLEGSLSERGISSDKTAFQAVNGLKKQCLKNWGMAAVGVGLALAGVGALVLGGVQLVAASGAGIMAMALGTALKSAGLAVGGLIGSTVGCSMFTGRRADSDYLKEQAATVQRLAQNCTVPAEMGPGSCRSPLQACAAPLLR